MDDGIAYGSGTEGYLCYAEIPLGGWIVERARSESYRGSGCDDSPQVARRTAVADFVLQFCIECGGILGYSACYDAARLPGIYYLQHRVRERVVILGGCDS